MWTTERGILIRHFINTNSFDTLVLNVISTLKKRYQICGVSKQIEILGKKFSFVIQLLKTQKVSSQSKGLFYFISTLKVSKEK